MPRLWTDTIDAHRRAVRDAILDAAAGLVAAHGLRAVTMAQIAEASGIGRATLYKYFPDVDAILLAWHERQVGGHLAHLAELRDRPGDPTERLEAVLEAYALIHHELASHHGQASHPHHGAQIAAMLHQAEHVGRAQQQLTELMRDLIADCAKAGVVRDDVPPRELADHCLHTLTAAAKLPSVAAVRRLVTVTLSGLRPGGCVRRSP